MTLTGEVPVVSTSARRAYEDLQRGMAGIETPCSPDRAWEVSLSTQDWTDETPLNREAKKRCTECPVLVLCRDYALAAGEQHGVWGGMLPHERSALIRSRRR